MPLDESTRRFAFLLQRDLRRIEERERAREGRGEEVHYDRVSGVATWESRRGDVIGRWYGDSLATYSARDRILRWSWAFRETSDAASHAEIVFLEGQSRGVPQLAMSVVSDIDATDAMTLVRLGAVTARADGIHVERRDDDTIELIGLFESARPSDLLRESANRISVPPPPVVPGVSPTSSTGVLSLANVALAAMTQRCPGFKQGLLVVIVDEDVPRRQPVVQLVALDASGALRALDPTTELVEAAASIIGDARWRKLTARIHPKPDGGATLHVDVT